MAKLRPDPEDEEVRPSFKEATEPYTSHVHPGLGPLLKVVYSSLEGDPPPPHVVCKFCGEDLTHNAGKSTIDMRECFSRLDTGLNIVPRKPLPA